MWSTSRLVQTCSVICERDMEGIVAEQAGARYTPEATTWVKIKNREYSQAVGREDFFAS
jgi:ATP-dependent DNA ligase